MFFSTSLVAIATLLVVYRLYVILPDPRRTRRRRPPSATCKVAVFLGSGGHTSEALTLMSALDFRRYNYRIYLVSEGDFLSAKKALDFEAQHETHGEEPQCTVLTIPRARRVHQSLLTTPFSAAWSLMLCIYHLTLLPLLKFHSTFADVLILNGPGTCFVLCLAVYLNRFLGLPSPTLIYVETFARVKSLSLSGKLIRPLADRFVTQWSLLGQKPLTSETWLV